MKSHKSEKQLFVSFGRKSHSSSKNLEVKPTKPVEQKLFEDEEFNTVNDEFEKQHAGFMNVIKALFEHLQHIKNSPQTLLNIGNAFLSFYNPEDDVYNHVLQYKSACQLKQSTEDDYCAAYEILYSNANSCVLQYLELKERRKKLKNRKIDMENAKKRVEEAKKKKGQKGLDEMLEKEQIATIAFYELRAELLKDMCLMMNMVVKYRTIIFSACVEFEIKRKEGINEALSMVKRFGGHEGATPIYVITKNEESFIHDTKAKKMHDKLKRHGEKYQIQQFDNTSKTTQTPVMTPSKPKPPVPKALPVTPEEAVLDSQENQLKNDIINSLRSEIFADDKKKKPEPPKEKPKTPVIQEKKPEPIVEVKKEEPKVEQPIPIVEEKKEETNPFADEPEPTPVKEEKKEETNPFVDEPKPIVVEEKKEETNPFVDESKEEEERKAKQQAEEEEQRKKAEEEARKEEEERKVKQQAEEEERKRKEEEERKQREEQERLENERKQQEEQERLRKEAEEKARKEEEERIAKEKAEEEERKRKEEEERIEKEKVTEEISSSIEIKTPSKPIMRVKAIYDYEATDEGELSMSEGDILDIYDNDGDWWTAELNGQRGLIPANFIEFL